MDLLEHAVLIAQTVARGWELHRGHRVEEARRETAQASVPQARIRFLLDQFKPIDTFFLNCMLHQRDRARGW